AEFENKLLYSVLKADDVGDVDARQKALLPVPVDAVSPAEPRLVATAKPGRLDPRLQLEGDLFHGWNPPLAKALDSGRVVSGLVLPILLQVAASMARGVVPKRGSSWRARGGQEHPHFGALQPFFPTPRHGVLCVFQMPPKKAGDGPKQAPLIGRFGTSLKIGIVGLPNVGKSTFFNVLTKSQAAAENFPFCTIDPNESRVPVPDERFDFLCQFHKPASKVPAFLNVVDIAGLVKGAHAGQGLGNAFLSHISACDGIFHMTRKLLSSG
ncbi:hypothetical protein Z043_111167, partial [Scleropages formosus]